ncbi:hypothetical protein ASPWEDRAFT_45871 [Aspergillus wentii DTO 134E9]|uniref:Thioesterase domain-containing protein n=1 Tax=Aspergillus wentii DTO 134E9 TaxID=1073089 RepID=A0A1L9R617_ASPWE|nr:uncharacterized protein ASPWEDRAFT_45871 [Aspergillus wentii DTO 134E9]KAI9925188.1 Thioesterase super member 4 [Aspergillus wentii]OJJ30323.1 hypothetical protein ASPWEDRAFT_45871 [Aspergillus wentii DTO 134E9]
MSFLTKTPRLLRKPAFGIASLRSAFPQQQQQQRSVKIAAAVHDDISSTSTSSSSSSPSPSSTPGKEPFLTPTPAQQQHKIDTVISNLPIVQSLRHDHTFKESRPHLTMPPALRGTHFVGGAITGSGKVTVAPYMFTSKKSSTTNANTRVVSLFHIGSELCGHPGFVHGGLLSVMFDEAFARCVSASFPSGLGMTANLNVDFRKPATPDRVYVLRAETVKVEGRKAWVEGKMTCLSAVGREDSEAVMVAEARALFIEPKFAESMVPLYRN